MLSTISTTHRTLCLGAIDEFFRQPAILEALDLEQLGCGLDPVKPSTNVVPTVDRQQGRPMALSSRATAPCTGLWNSRLSPWEKASAAEERGGDTRTARIVFW
jgi:hypothetical protein